MNQAAAEFIRTVCEGTMVGIVRFESKASTLLVLTEISSEEDRQRVIQKLTEPGNSGGTCIGCGLRTGLAVCTVQ